MQPNLKTSARLDLIKPSITLAVTAKAAKLKAAGTDVISFGAGEPDFDTPAHIKEAARQGLDKGVGKYTDVAGLVALREAVAAELSRVHGVSLTAANIEVSTGAKHSLYNIFMAVLDPGDEVLIPAPYWVSYPDMVTLAGGVPVIVPSTAENDFVVSAAAVEKAITPRTRMLVLNTPNNPSGAVIGAAQMAAIAEVVVRRNLLVVSDDIYRSLVYGDAAYVSFARQSPEAAARTILVDGLSKAYAMTGWRVGYTAAPVSVIAAMNKLQGQSTSNPTHIAQVAAIAALTGPQECVETMRQAFDERRIEMVKLLRAIPEVTCREPKGAFYAFPDVSAYLGRKTPQGQVLADDVALCDWLVEAGHVAVVPGSGFGAPGHVRLSYACSLEQIRRGIARLSESLLRLGRAG